MSNTILENNRPVLRFPEFRGEWEEFKLEEKYFLISGQHLTPDEYSFKKRVGLSPYFTGPSDFTNCSENVKKWSLKKWKIAKKGDILFTVKGSGVGLAMLLKLDKVTMGRQLMAISSSVSSTEFLHHKLALFKKYYEALASGNMIPGLSRNDLLTTKIDLPPIPEQQKIAQFLTAVDCKTQQLTKKKQLLEQYKKGVMQQLFSQKLRFKDENGNAFPDWEEIELGKRMSVKTGNKDTQDRKDGAEFPFFVRSNTVESIDTYSFDGEAILTSGDGVGVGKNFHYINGKFDYHQRVYCLYNFSSNTDGSYVYHYFKKAFYKRVMRLSAKNSVDSVRMDMITKMPFPFPAFSEQKKIANFLSAIDTKIDLVNTQLEKTQEFKKGLLQQMFV